MIGISRVVCSWELASTLKEYKDKFESAGVKLIAVGVGTPNKARLLAERVYSLPMILLMSIFCQNY